MVCHCRGPDAYRPAVLGRRALRPDGDDGYVLYKAKDNSDDASNDYGATLEVWDLIGANQAARNDLWRFLMEIDLVMRIDAYARPVDEPVELLLENPRSCVTRNIDDESWVRLIDVQAALAARTYGDADPVAVEVNDAFMPENSGTYLISRDGVTRGTEQAQLTLDVDTLGMLYFGAWKPTDLATSGRIKVFDADALARADRLFEADSIRGAARTSDSLPRFLRSRSAIVLIPTLVGFNSPIRRYPHT
ncbi:sterol carrier protein domain-containing protein [Kibdelosporangium philippinense]|uniref:sterol carrier protein domain-containing protein n=1 Tax=Kibdelosporangium philippinense TaxID=211113 RepID=UPI003616A2DA